MTRLWRSALLLCLGFAACNAADVVLYERADGGADAASAGVSGAIGSSSAGMSGGGASENGGGPSMSGSAGLSAGGALLSGGSAGTIAEAGAMNDGLVPCATNDDCPAAWFCSKAACADPMGSCAPRPLICDPAASSVCGCDHVNYWNSCVRKDYGVSADTVGECGTNAISCTTDANCPSGGTCAHLLIYPMSNCSAAGPGDGTCWGTPNDCAPGEFRHLLACPVTQHGPPTCVSTCEAIQSGQTYVQPPRGVCNNN